VKLIMAAYRSAVMEETLRTKLQDIQETLRRIEEKAAS